MAEVEGVPEPESQAETPPTDEEIASAKGWKDLDSWVEDGNDASQHVDAKTFNIRGQFIGDLKKYESEIRDLKNNQKRVSEILVEERKLAREQGVREAEERHAKAVEEGDVEGAKRALEDVKTQSKSPEPTAEVDPVEAWFDSNPEFRSDRALWKAFREEDEFLAFQKGGVQDVAAHLDEVKQRLETSMPEKFGNPARQEAPITDATPTRTRQRKPQKRSYSDLSDTQKSFCDEFVTMGHMTREEYIQGLVDSGDLT